MEGGEKFINYFVLSIFYLVFTWDLRVVSINGGINDIRNDIVRKTSLSLFPRG